MIWWWQRPTPRWTALAALVATLALAAGCSGGSSSLGGPPTSPPGPTPSPGSTPPFPLSVPAGFHVSMVSFNVPGARFMAVAPNGDLLVSQPDAGQVVKLNPNGPPGQTPQLVASGLPLPHGLAFNGSTLYIATWDGISVIQNYPSGSVQTLYAALIENSDHNRRSLAVAPDGSLYESYGSNENIATSPPSSPAENSIVHISANGATASAYATGVRNGSGLAFDNAGRLWMVVNQRDNVSNVAATNNVNPVDEFDLVQQADYGYPFCYPPNGTTNIARIPNPEFPSANCAGAAHVTLGILAHSAPLGIVFYYGSQFPPPYRGNAFVALHGSWNSTVPHGDKVVMVSFSGGSPTGAQDFVTGWLSGSSYLGRPVGLAVDAAGSLYISDDQNGFIYKVTYAP